MTTQRYDLSNAVDDWNSEEQLQECDDMLAAIAEGLLALGIVADVDFDPDECRAMLTADVPDGLANLLRLIADFGPDIR